MDVAPILVKCPKPSVTFIRVHLLMNAPYDIWVQSAQWFLRKRCFDMYVEVRNEWTCMKGQR